MTPTASCSDRHRKGTKWHPPSKIRHVDVLDIVLLKAEFDKAIHLLQALQAGNQIPIGAKFTQMSKTLQF